MAGFIHGKLDIKLLVLYLTSRLAGPVDFATLTDLAMCDDGVDYFVYAEAVSELMGRTTPSPTRAGGTSPSGRAASPRSSAPGATSGWPR